MAVDTMDCDFRVSGSFYGVSMGFNVHIFI